MRSRGNAGAFRFVYIRLKVETRHFNKIMRETIIALIAIAIFGFGAVAFADDQDRLRDRDQLQDRDQLHLCAASTDPLQAQAHMRVRAQFHQAFGV